MDTSTKDVKWPSEIRLRDPLSEVTRVERKTLLGVSTIGIMIAASGLVPSKISALGIEFDRANQAALLRLLSGVVAYFLTAFVVYAISDFVSWRVSFHNAVFDWILTRRLSADDEQYLLEHHGWQFFRQARFWSAAIGPVSIVRALFEFLVPVIIGICAVTILLRTPPPKDVGKATVSTSTSIPAGEKPATPAGSAAHP